MANAIYPSAKEAFISGATIDLDTDDIYVSLVDGYTYDSTDATGTDMSTGTWIQVGDNALASKTVTDGVFDAADLTFTAVPAGSAIEALIVHKATADYTGSTLTDSGDTVNETAHGFVANDRVFLTNIATTTGVSNLVLYHVINANANDFQLSLTQGGAAVVLTTDGTADLHNAKNFDLIAHIDTGTGLPVTPNGSDITITWDNGGDGIFAL